MLIKYSNIQTFDDVSQIFCSQGGVASPEEEEDNVQVSKVFKIVIGSNSINIITISSINIVISNIINNTINTSIIIIITDI